MSQYSLNAFELQMLVLAAERRNCGKQPNGVHNKKRDAKRSDFSINLHGIMGEFAVSKLLGIKIDTSISLAGDDKVADLTLGKASIQVKTAIGNISHPHLAFQSMELFKADVAVLTTVTCATEIIINGWITRDAFRIAAKPWDTPYGRAVAVSSANLQSPEYLLRYLETA